MSRQRIMGAAPAVFVAIAAGFAAAPFLADGLPVLFDGHAHLARSFFVARALAEGTFPAWSLDWYGGYRALEFYSPGWFLVTGALTPLFSGVVPATKWLLWGGQVGAVLVFYAYVKRCFGDPWIAAFAALLLAGCSELRMALGVVCNFPSVALYIGGPVLLWHIVRCPAGAAASDRRAWSAFALGQALLIGGMTWFHFSNTLLILPGILAFELVWIWPALADVRSRRLAVTSLLASGAGALLLATPVLLPLLADSGLVSLSIDRAGRSGGFNVEMVLRILGLRDYSFEFLFVRAHSRVWLLLAGAAAAAALLPSDRVGERWRRMVRALTAGFVMSLLAVMAMDVRAVIATAFFLFPLCAASLDFAMRLAPERIGPTARWLLPSLAIAAALALPENRDTPLPNYAAPDALDIYTRLPVSGHGRTFDVSESPMSLDGFYGSSSFSPSLSGRSVPFGGMPQASPLVVNVTMALAGRLVADLTMKPAPRLGDESLDLLHLLHVEFLVDRREQPILPKLALAASQAAPQTLPADPRILQLSNASPILACARQALAPDDFPPAAAGEPRLMGFVREQWAKAPLGAHRFPSLDSVYRTGARRDWPALVTLLRSMEIDRAAGHCEVVHVERLLERPNENVEGRPRTKLLDHRESWRNAELDVDVQARGYLRLSYSDDPSLRVRVDGAEVERTRDVLTGAVVLHLSEGRHTITLERAPSRGRIAVWIMAGVLTAAMLILWISSERGRRNAWICDSS